MNRTHFCSVSVILACAFASASAFACKCAPDDWFVKNESHVEKMFEAADFIVHAKVVEFLDSENARIEILETFKRSYFPLHTVSIAGKKDPCAGRLQVGDEKIFISRMAQ
jgi:hypothetical protein